MLFYLLLLSVRSYDGIVFYATYMRSADCAFLYRTVLEYVISPQKDLTGQSSVSAAHFFHVWCTISGAIGRLRNASDARFLQVQTAQLADCLNFWPIESFYLKLYVFASKFVKRKHQIYYPLDEEVFVNAIARLRATLPGSRKRLTGTLPKLGNPAIARNFHAPRTGSTNNT